MNFLRLGRYYPLTIIGTPVTLGLLFLLGKGFATANPYLYLLSLAGLGLILLLVPLSLVQARGIGEEEIDWNSRHRVFASRGAAPHSLSLQDRRLFPFFRLRYLLSGDIYAGDCANSHGNSYGREYVPTVRLAHHRRSGRFRPGVSGKGATSTELSLPLSLPHCGRYHANLTLAVEDIFGLTRAQIGTTRSRTIPVFPGVLGREAVYRIAERGAEEQNRMKESEIERYYMRDYVPGDRFRDINWKASGRGTTLYTRISPIAQEETTTITIYARFHSPNPGLSPALLALAEYQKSWIISFILKVREEHPAFLFQLFLNEQEYLLESDQEVERFAEELGSVWFTPAPTTMPALPREGRVYLFATSAEESLHGFYEAFPGSDFQLNLTRIADTEERKRGTSIALPLYTDYQGEDFPSFALVWGGLKRDRRLSRRFPSVSEEACLDPHLIRREEHR